MEWERREFLQALALIYAVGSTPFLLVGCSEDQAQRDVDDLGAPFGLWRKAREAIRKSPDHLQQRAIEVVESKDLASIFTFVRDSIVTRPWAEETHSVQVERAGYVGLRGALRSGIATPREKAEILQDLLQKAGFAAEIVDGEIDFASMGAAEAFAGLAQPKFAPDSAIAPIDAWLERLALKPSSLIRDARLDQQQIDGLATKLEQAFPRDQRTKVTDWAKRLRWLPLVRVQNDQQSIYANPNVRGAELGEHYCKREPRPSKVQTPIPTPTLKLALSICRARAQTVQETILEGEWQIADVVGRRIRLSFLPARDVEDLLALPIGQIRTFVPTLTVAGRDLEESEAAKLGFRADPITIEGDRLSGQDGKLLVNGVERPLGDADPQRARHVARIDPFVDASEYPRLRIEASITDSENNAISGLPASVFSFLHDETPAEVSLLRNEPRPPRILFALDYSSSLPKDFQGPQTSPLVQRVASAIKQLDPAATFRAGKFSGHPPGRAIEHFSDWTDDVAVVTRSIRDNPAVGFEASSYWEALAEGTNSDASLTVVITDADGGSNGSPELRAQVSEGGPAVIIAVRSGMTKQPDLRALSELTGHLFEVDDVDVAAKTIVDRVRSQIERPYLFEMVASKPVAGRHTVAMTTPSSGASAEASYEAPDVPVPAARAISSLFLTVELGRRRVTRRLAGFPLARHPEHKLGSEHLVDAHLAFLGRYDISVEGSAPTASAALDDLLSGFLTAEPMMRAAPTRDVGTIVQASGGVDELPRNWLALNAPLPGRMSETSLTFQSGYRIVLQRDVPDREGHFRRSADILPFATWQTIAADGRDEFAHTLRHSLQLSFIEAANYVTSTVSSCRSREFTAIKPFQFNGWVRSIEDSEDNLAWTIASADRGLPRLQNWLIIPTQSSDRGYFEIDPGSGTVLGMLPDASGGGSAADTARRFDLLSQVISAYSDLIQALMATPPAFQVWVALEKAKLEHLKRATIAIILMDGTNTSGYGELLEEQILGWAQAKVRGVADSAAGELVSGYSNLRSAVNWHNQLQALWGAASEESS